MTPRDPFTFFPIIHLKGGIERKKKSLPVLHFLTVLLSHALNTYLLLEEEEDRETRSNGAHVFCSCVPTRRPFFGASFPLVPPPLVGSGKVQFWEGKTLAHLSMMTGFVEEKTLAEPMTRKILQEVDFYEEDTNPVEQIRSHCEVTPKNGDHD